MEISSPLLCAHPWLYVNGKNLSIEIYTVSACIDIVCIAAKAADHYTPKLLYWGHQRSVDHQLRRMKCCKFRKSLTDSLRAQVLSQIDTLRRANAKNCCLSPSKWQQWKSVAHWALNWLWSNTEPHSVWTPRRNKMIIYITAAKCKGCWEIFWKSAFFFVNSSKLRLTEPGND